MQYTEVLHQLKDYIVNQVLDGQGHGLDENTPLLEWGVMNSLEIVRLISFIRKQFCITISSSQMVADNFKDLKSITDLVLRNMDDTGMEIKIG